MEDKTIKAINFDLKQHLLDRYYDKSNTTAYYEIEKFMKANGFEHRQGSGYLSQNQIDMDTVYNILDNLKDTLPWTRVCIEKIDVTDKLVEIQNDEFMEDRIRATMVFDEIKHSGYRISPELVNPMLAYHASKNEIPDLSNLEELLHDEPNIQLKEFLTSMIGECESQKHEKMQSRYGIVTHVPESEIDLER